MGENDWKNVLEEEAKSVANSPSPIMSQLGKNKAFKMVTSSDESEPNWLEPELEL